MEVLEDRMLLSTFVVNNTNDSGAGSLRQAILDANANPGVDTIDFSISGSGVQTITPTSQLPTITDPVTIDGTSQSGYAAGQPIIELDGSQAGNSIGLLFQIGGNTVEGLVICNFAQFGIVLDGSTDLGHGNIIKANFIGTDSSGTQSRPNGAGILLFHSSQNLIGGLDANGKLVAGNLISGNSQSGIEILDRLSTGNHIEGNFIGTDISGLSSLGNGLDGVFLGAAQFGNLQQDGFASGDFVSNFVVASQVFDPNARNIISGNMENGVYILGGSQNQVQGNYIGLGADGETRVPNDEDGVRIEDASLNTVGGTVANSGNVISANKDNGASNTGDGVEILGSDQSENFIAMSQSASNNLIQGNLIGTDATGTFSDPDDMPNSGDELGNTNGIEIRNESTNTAVVVSLNVIGGVDADDGTLDGNVKARNIISGNLQNGILFDGTGIVGNEVEGNKIGTDLTGENAVPNVHVGILLNSIVAQFVGPSGNIIGGTQAGAGNVISGNGIPGSSDGLPADGVLIANGSNGNFVLGNLIGRDAMDKENLGNADDGVVIRNAANNFIGGADAVDDQNIIQGNLNDGVEIDGSGAKNNMVQSNFIGGNGTGVVITQVASDGSPSGNFIGGTKIVSGAEVNLGNVISANSTDGVDIDLGATANQVIGNTIEANIFNGVAIFNSASNTIGGSTPAQTNFIVKNGASGVLISGLTATLNSVIGDFIGLGPDGVSPQGNGADGVDIVNAPGNIIGLPGTGTGVRGNDISANTGAGVHIEGMTATHNVLTLNFIGTDSTGTKELGNDDGVLITDGAASNIINFELISGNKLNGVEIEDSPNNTLQNSRIGTDRTGTTPLRNLLDGVVLTDAPGTIIGGGTYNDVGGGGNLISGNGHSGVYLNGLLTTGTIIQANHIGISTDAGGDNPLPNALSGIAILSDPHTGAPSQTFVQNNVIAANLQYGILLESVSGIHITGNEIGTNADFSDTIPNLGYGILMVNSPRNDIGGADADEINTIAFTTKDPSDSDSGDGIDINGAGSTGNHIVGNVVTQNTNSGILIDGGASANVIGSTASGGGNAIGFNLGTGVLISGMGTSNNVLEGNFIGISGDGTAAGNQGSGVAVIEGASGNIIGGTTEDARNIISANAPHGVFIGSQAHDNTVSGNYIGANLNGVFEVGLGNAARRS